MILEVIATSVQDALDAQRAGADRIELVSAIAEGGLTPSYGLIAHVMKQTTIPVQVMIRPHSYSFHYSADDIATMCTDIAMCKQLGVAGVVFGCLTADGQIHEPHLQALLAASEGLDVTFHRAFDEVDDQLAACVMLQQYPAVRRVLTSGGQADVTAAKAQIAALQQASLPVIMPGSGITVDKLAAFLDGLAVQELHIGSGARHGHRFAERIDAQKIAAIRTIWAQANGDAL